MLGRRVRPNEIDSLVGQQLEGGGAWADRGDMDNAAGLLRAIRALAGSPLQRDFIMAALKRLTDPDPQVRAGALHVVRSFGSQVGAAPLLLQAWRRQPELYRGVAIGTREGDLESLLFSAMAVAALPGDSEVINFLRGLARDPEKRDLVIGGLARADPDWMVDHVPDWLGDDGQRLAAVLGNMPDETKVERVVRSVSKTPQQVRAGAAEVIRRFVPDRDRAAHLISLLR